MGTGTLKVQHALVSEWFFRKKTRELLRECLCLPEEIAIDSFELMDKYVVFHLSAYAIPDGSEIEAAYQRKADGYELLRLRVITEYPIGAPCHE